jgi:hypothetical protein
VIASILALENNQLFPIANYETPRPLLPNQCRHPIRTTGGQLFHQPQLLPARSEPAHGHHSQSRLAILVFLFLVSPAANERYSRAVCKYRKKGKHRVAEDAEHEIEVL